MKFNALSVILLFICLGLIIYIWNPADIFNREVEAVTEPETAAEPEPHRTNEIWIPPEDEWVGGGAEEVRRHIDEDIINALEDISGVLTTTRIKDIHEFFNKRSGFITTLKGKKLPANAIQGYLNSQMNQGTIDEIKFELTWFVAEENTKKAMLPDDPQNMQDVLHYVQLGFKVSFIYQGGVIDPPGGRDDDHIRDCTWNN